jgi:hypothetical protein
MRRGSARCLDTLLRARTICASFEDMKTDRQRSRAPRDRAEDSTPRDGAAPASACPPPPAPSPDDAALTAAGAGATSGVPFGGLGGLAGSMEAFKAFFAAMPANSDMANFLKSTGIATLFLDGELRIKLFTPATTRVIKLIPSDAGRPIGDLSMSFINYDLTADARRVAKVAAVVIEREVRHTDGSCYLVRVIPYRTPHGQTDGVVVTFTDVTGLRRAEEDVHRLATVLTDSNNAVLLFDPDGSVIQTVAKVQCLMTHDAPRAQMTIDR